MITRIWDFLSTEGFQPHGMCLLWRPDVFWMHLVADAVIVISYFSIPAALFYLATRRPDLIYRRVFYLFGAFIVACGVTHMISIWTMWVPDYSISALVKVVTAGISVVTAAVLWPMMPKLLALPSTKQLAEKNAELAREIEERKLIEAQLSLLNRELKHAQAKAEEASLAKSQFVATMSHEIRTPMNGVLSATGLLEKSELTPEQRELVEIVKDSGDALMVLLNDILDLSKIEAGRLELENAEFSIEALLVSTQSLWSPLAEEKGLALSIRNNAPDCDRVRGDSVRLTQVINNLLNNAIKFTEAGEVELTVEQVPGNENGTELKFVVRDSGIGISDEQMERLFAPFSQGDSSTTRKFGGTGLGLKISKDIVELMHGSIGVERHHDRGSVFWFTVKFQPVAAAARADRPAVDAPAMPIDDTRKLRILLAEDNPINQKLLTMMLASLAGEIDVVGDGREAVEAVASARYDLVLMDVQMPEMDGIAATRRIREAETGQECLPIIGLTANAMVGDRERYLDAGMTDYVSKPVDHQLLMEAIARAAASVGGRRGASGIPVKNGETGAEPGEKRDGSDDIDTLMTSIDRATGNA